MVSCLVTEDEGNRALEEEIENSSDEPNVSERVQMVTVILRPTTAQMVLGQEALFLPDNHSLLRQIQNLVAIQGRVLASSDGPALTCLELTIHMADKEVNTLVSSLMSDRADSLILGGCLCRWSCLGLNPSTIELGFVSCLKRVTHCSIGVMLAML